MGEKDTCMVDNHAWCRLLTVQLTDSQKMLKEKEAQLRNMEQENAALMAKYSELQHVLRDSQEMLNETEGQLQNLSLKNIALMANYSTLQHVLTDSHEMLKEQEGQLQNLTWDKVELRKEIEMLQAANKFNLMCPYFFPFFVFFFFR